MCLEVELLERKSNSQQGTEYHCTRIHARTLSHAIDLERRSRRDTSAAQRRADLLGCVTLLLVSAASASREQFLAHLAHALLLLHCLELLVLSVRQRKRHAHQQCGHRQVPRRLAREGRGRVHYLLRAHPLAVGRRTRGRRDYVAELIEAVAEGLLGRVEVRLSGNLGV